MLTSLSALLLLSTVYASPIAILEERQTQQVDLNYEVSGSQFQSFQDANTLKQYLRSQGVTYNFDYNKLSAGVTAVDNYFATKAQQTTTSSNSNGFTNPNSGAVQTDSESTSLKGGPSYTNASLSAQSLLVQAITFSDGDAACAGGAIQRSKTTSSTSSSGASNSTASVTGNSQPVMIVTNATVSGAADSEDVVGGTQDALTAGSCAARATGASARSSILTTLTVPINTSGSTTFGSTAQSFCEAGVSAKQSGKSGDSGTSSSGTQAALTDGGVTAEVTCNGQRKTSSAAAVTFNLKLQGTYSSAAGFAGTFTGMRTASASISCT
ncbi:hypothetical protein DOTSEDRAFT_81283 [Dothistroma septosporum NZE10]|uniref:Uncharacterized protein n=1 Tax=Dothistroma septosporum (strain NZE10 / CBS 128990) TaxID=675120 RepID=N1PLF5_DOTSN|nr:hypothetical protein DOTSEDRAFT_81283 [Dothistroma septosporum NZE10]